MINLLFNLVLMLPNMQKNWKKLKHSYSSYQNLKKILDYWKLY